MSILLITLKGEINKKMALKQGERNSYVRKRNESSEFKKKEKLILSMRWTQSSKHQASGLDQKWLNADLISSLREQETETERECQVCED